MNIEEIKDRVNITKNAFHKLGIEGQVNINVMLNDIEFLLTAYEKEKEKNKDLKEGYKIQEHNYQVAMKEIEQRWEDKIKAKIEEVKDGTYDAKIILQSLLEKE